MIKLLALVGLLFLGASCQKKNKAPPVTEAPDNGIAAAPVVPGTNGNPPPALPVPGPELPIVPKEPLTPPVPATPVTPPIEVPVSPVQKLLGLKIQAVSDLQIAKPFFLKTFAVYEGPAEEKEVTAQWKILANEAELQLKGDGSFIAKTAGSAKLEASFEGQLANIELQFEYPMLQVTEEQFWVYSLEGQKTRFNDPWDSEQGDAIKRDRAGVPEYALKCLDEAQAEFSQLQSREQIKASLGKLILAGASPRFIYLVNVVGAEGRRDVLRRLDRDAYFWHWTELTKRPSLAMSNFKKGVWVWEIIASPQSCIKSSEKQMQRYLDYAGFRLGLPK
ncbi:MAG: hypothetical protein NTX25_05390 [Proteobacteria bacterium]|nr:hypothetical protein [Pseudomonadota bacterium]